MWENPNKNPINLEGILFRSLSWIMLEEAVA
jgi:hypothetical protein